MADEQKPLRGKEFRDAVKAAESGLHRQQRISRARPWKKRDRFAQVVPGVRVMPPEKRDEERGSN